MENKKILIVEDQAIIANDIALMLECAGYKVLDIVDTADLAVERALSEDVDLILMDINLKGKKTGIDASRIIAERSDIPIVFLTAYADKQTLDEIQTISSYGFLIKPVDADSLLRIIEVSFQRYNVSVEIMQKNLWFSAILDSFKDVVVVVDINYKIKFVNKEAELFIGIEERDLLAHHITEFFQIQDSPKKETFHKLHVRALSLGSASCDDGVYLGTKGKKKKRIPVEINVYRVSLSYCGATDLVYVFRNVTKRREVLDLLVYQAYHDSLTRCLNRDGLLKEVQDRQSRLFFKRENITVLFIDFDTFKAVNNIYGHDVGDCLIVHIVQKIRQNIRETDLFARWGGDEFVVVLFDCDKEVAYRRAEAIRACVEQSPFELTDKQKDFLIRDERSPFSKDTIVSSVAVTVSIGFFYSDLEQERWSDILKRADVGCSVAKTKGRNQVFVIENDGQDAEEERKSQAMLFCIKDAISNSAFELFYQPIITLGEQGVFDFVEIFMRMVDKKGNLVPPHAFLAIAERNNLIFQIDHFVMENVFEYISLVSFVKLWSINMSGLMMDTEGFPFLVKSLAEKYSIDCGKICFDVTERMVTNFSNILSHINILRSMGCKVALDDFGIGQNSIKRLSCFPVDFVKIDGCFIEEFNLVNQAIVGAIVQICNVMNKERLVSGDTRKVITIAEFVQSQEVTEQLFELGVNCAQGYFYGKPQPLSLLSC